MKTAIIKLILQMLSDEKNRQRLFLVIASIVVGLLGMMVMPFVVLSVMGEMEPPEIIIDKDALLSGVNTDRLTAMESDGQAIAYYLSSKGLRRQIIKAQLIYVSYFETAEIDTEEYAGYFSIKDDAMLIGCLSSVYGLEIDYDEFERTYMLVKNVTIDKYLFTNVNTKNSTDLAAWCRNAYESEWLYQPGGFGDLDENLRRRTADNVGLILGYFNYNPSEKVLGNSINTLIYTVQGGMDTIDETWAWTRLNTETAKAIRMHVDEDDKGVSVLDTPGGRQRFTVINESGLYSLILSSKLNKAKQFKRWVTSDILPTIRRTGGYVSNDELFTNTYLPFADDNTKALFRLQLMTIRQLNARIEHDQPLVEFAEHVASTNDVIDMNTMAKLAAQKNIRIGRTRMMRWMKKKKILLPNNLPYQKYIDKGYFVVKETTYKRGSKTFTYQQAFVTGKGQVFLINRLKAEYLEGV